MPVYRFERTQKIPVDLHTAWEFFLSPANLGKITPPEMDFVITGRHPPEKMYPGMIITYTVRPVLGIRMQWVTEITQVREPHFFIDEQRSGPYRIWHHQHHFTEIPGGVEMEDIIHYKLPMSLLSFPFRGLLVEKQLNRVFDFRKETLIKMFGKYEKQE